MKTAIAAMLLIGCLAGCQNVGQQLSIERQSFNASLTAIHAAHVAGALPTAKERELLPYLAAVQAALDAADAAYLAGDVNAANVYLQAAVTGLTKLDTSLKPAKGPPP